MIPHPDEDDVAVRRKGGNPGVIFVLGTAPAPDQFTLRTRDEAVAQALAFAKRQHVCAWFTNGGDELVLLGTFRKETMKLGNALAKRKTEISSVSRNSAKAASLRGAVVEDSEIARHASDLYLARGRAPGGEVADWLQAERELRRPTSG